MPEDGESTVELSGNLAGILALCFEGKKRQPGRLDTVGLEAQFKLVVGARNQLSLLFSASGLKTG